MLSIKMTRVYESESDLSETTRKCSISINPADIYYYQEYVGDSFSEIDEPKTLITLVSGETFCVLLSFDKVYKLESEYRIAASKELIWKLN